MRYNTNFAFNALYEKEELDKVINTILIINMIEHNKSFTQFSYIDEKW